LFKGCGGVFLGGSVISGWAKVSLTTSYGFFLVDAIFISGFRAG